MPINTDSISIWIKYAKKTSYSLKHKKYYLKKAYKYNSRIKNDSLKTKNLVLIAYRFYKLNDSIKFKSTIKEAYSLASQLKDSFSLGRLHWNYANFNKKKEDYTNSYFHFNKAYEYFENIKENNSAAIMLYGMAQIKGRYRDYAGSEILNIKAIKKFTSLNNNKYLSYSYNHLAILQRDIKEYDKALEYYDKSLKFYNTTENSKKKYLGIYNNIANIYLEKKEYQKALEYYNRELKEDLNINKYARVLNNRAYCKLLMKDTVGIKDDFYKALHIRDSLKNKVNVLNSKIHISYFYSHSQDTLKAIKYAKEANILSKKIKNGGDYLTTLKQLANLDKQNSKKYLDRYIVFNDSLISAERRIQNKFTRIAFETDEYIEETKRLTQQRIWIFITSLGTLLILSLLYFLRVQKVQNEKLSLEAEQQKANEEVYVLTLQQQAKLEEEKVKERNRISEELHDGILGKLFGTRFGLGFLPLQGNEETLEKHQSLLNELQEIEKEIRDVSHKLSDNFDSSNINFTAIIEQLLKDKSIVGNFEYHCNFDNTIPWKTINEVTKANVYRIIQEALQNIIKHANAKNVILDFSINNQNLAISLKDDGIGFNPKKGKKGIGLKNITSRIKKIHGTIKIQSTINVGTTLFINTPLHSLKNNG
ncbi:tetratricopeptide repeat protein [Tenacibaculum sp.]|nr:tetratricopeptide repeat protein [Tenacibaculum sp.]